MVFDRYYHMIKHGVLILAWAAGLTAIIFLIQVPPASGYELSIYNALPYTFWIPFLLSLVLHISVAVTTSWQDNDSDQTLWLFAVIGIFLSTLILIFLPDIRGYSSKGLGDLSSHIGQSKTIAETGFIHSKVFYPAAFAMIQVVHLFTGIKVETIWRYGDALVYLAYILFVWLAAGSIFNNKKSPVLLASLAAAVHAAGAYPPSLVPGNLSVAFLPLLIYLYYTSRNPTKTKLRILFLLALLLYPFLHPLTSMLLIGFLLIMEAERWLADFVQRRAYLDLDKNTRFSKPIRGGGNTYNVNPPLILSITWFIWFSSFSLWNNSVNKVFNWLQGEAYTQLERVSYLAGRAQFTVQDTAWLILKDKGGVLLYLGFALLILAVFFLLPKGRLFLSLEGKQVLSTYGVLLLTALTAGFALVGPFGDLDFGRMLRYIVPFATLLIGAAAVDLFRIHRLQINMILFVFFSLASIGGILGMHNSPYKFQPNGQVTLQDFSCTRWLLSYKADHPITAIWSAERYVDLVIGPVNRRARQDISLYPLPERFGYNQSEYLGAFLLEETYFIIRAYDRATTLELWRVADKFRQEDFDRLAVDPSVIKVYENGECQVWVTRPWLKEKALITR